MKTNKTKMIFARLKPEEADKFKEICDKKNDTPSRIIRNYIINMIKNNSHLLSK